MAQSWLFVLHFHNVFGVDAKGTHGGLLLFWNNNMSITLRSYSFSHIDVDVVWESICWRFTGCYGPPNREERKSFWDLLCKLRILNNNNSASWVLGGDFNDIPYESEKKGGIQRNINSTNLFNNCCNVLNLSSVTTSGPKYTWNNKRRGSNNIKQKLDRFLASKHWKDLIPQAIAKNCGFYGSDHRAVKLTLNHKKWVKKEPCYKPFTFENKWLLEDSFPDHAKNSWQQTNNKDNLLEKLKHCSSLIQSWAKGTVCNTGRKL